MIPDLASGEDRPLQSERAGQVTISAARLALAIKRARAEAGANAGLLGSEPIAIVGIGCRFPGDVRNPEEYWDFLEEGRTGIRLMPEDRWRGTRERLPQRLLLGGYLDDIDRFDPEFFGIAPKEAHSIDPQQRLLLEVCWEAIADAGMVPPALSGSRTGVFVAIYSSDYLRMQLDADAQVDAHTGVGAAHSVAAGRLSFLLNLQGPSLAVDTACSSSLVATHLACQSLRKRECEMALVGASSLKLLPDEVRAFEQWGMLASDGQAKAFDASADGFVPGEGAAMLLLKRLSDAIGHGDRIRAVIRGTAVNHDGRSSVLTAPRGPAQEAVIRTALEDARVSAGDVSYVETHGTGTSLGDPIEVEALDAVYGIAAARESNSEWWQDVFLGAVKTNFGHLEAAAGLAGLIKVVLSLEHECIPRNLNFKQLNPKIVPATASRLRFLSEATGWPRRVGSGAAPRFAGVSAFGLGGTNAHLILEEAPLLPMKARTALPLPAWNRQRYWLADPLLADAPWVNKTVDVGGTQSLLGREISSAFLEGMSWEHELSSRQPSWAGEHCWMGEPIWPFAAWLEWARVAAEALLQRSGGTGRAKVCNFAVHRRLQLSDAPLRLQSMATHQSSPNRSTPHQGVTHQGTTHQGEVKFAAFIKGGWHSFASGYWEERIEETDHESMRSTLNVEELKRRASSIDSAEETYRGLSLNGLTYGGSFRRMERVYVGTDFALGEIARFKLQDAGVARSAKAAEFHPPLLDACLQTVHAVLGRRGADFGYLPISVRGYSFSGEGEAAYALVRTRAEAGAETEVDLTIADPVGKPIARIEGLRLRRTVARQAKVPVWQIRWIAEGLADAAKSQGLHSERAAWVVWEDDREGAGSNGQSHGLRGTDAVSSITQEFLRIGLKVHDIEDWRRDSWSLGKSISFLVAGSLRSVTAKVLEIVRMEQAQPGVLRQLVVITRGACAAIEGESVNPEQAAVLGMGRSFRAEYPMVAVRLIDLDWHSARSAEMLVEYLLQRDGEWKSEEVALRNGRVFRTQLEALVPEEGSHSAEELMIGEPGLLDTLQSRACSVDTPGRGEIQIECLAHGMNFRDVLMALGNYVGASAALGAECSGLVTRCGEESQFECGDAVIAFAPSSLRSIVNVASSFVARLPAGMSFAQGATIPVAFLTAHFGFSRLAKLEAGQTVLVHSAAGGLGHAAIQLARLQGADVLATAGSEEKRIYLREQGIEHVFDSRSESFAEDVLTVTRGRGVDVVLNSLPGKMIAAGLRALGRGGVFLEVGKREIWSPERVDHARPDVQYFAYDLGEEALREPALIQTMWGELSANFAAGKLRPLPFEAYGIDEARDAFRQMASGRHIGKLVLTRHRPVEASWRQRWKEALRQGTVLITGGTGALGLATARWMIAQGARSLVLLSRRGATLEVNELIAEAVTKGVRIVADAVDVADYDQVKAAISRIGEGGNGPLRVVVHAAGEVEDGLLQSQTIQSMECAWRTKVEGARNLDELTRDHALLATVYYSSLAAVLGSAGQAGYASANAFLDGMATDRTARGLYTVSVNWGAWAGDGMAGELSDAMKLRIERQGIRPMPPGEALAGLEECLAAGRPRAAIADVDWKRFAAQFPPVSAAADSYASFASSIRERYQATVEHVGSQEWQSDLKSSEHETSKIGISRSQLASIKDAIRSDRLGMMEGAVRGAARAVLGLSEGRSMPFDLPLQDLGLDSLLALELRNILAQALECPLSATLLFDYPTIRELSSYLLELLHLDDGEKSSLECVFNRYGEVKDLSANLDGMTDEQAEEMLLAELERGRG